MIKTLRYCLIIISGIFLGQHSFGQTVAVDSAREPALARMAYAYNKAIGQQSRLYNGPEYDLYDPNIKGNANFSDVNVFTAGTVNYDGIFYKDVPMMYDLFKDVVAVRLYNNFSRFILVRERVQDFTWLNHHFIYIAADSSKGMSTGYYDQLYNNNHNEVLVKRSKTIQTTPSAATIETYFTETKNAYYLRKGNTYYNINGQSALLDVLKDKKKELQQYIKANKIKFRKTPETAIVAIVTRYSEVSK